MSPTDTLISSIRSTADPTWQQALNHITENPELMCTIRFYYDTDQIVRWIVDTQKEAFVELTKSALPVRDEGRESVERYLSKVINIFATFPPKGGDESLLQMIAVCAELQRNRMHLVPFLAALVNVNAKLRSTVSATITTMCKAHRVLAPSL